MLARVLDVTVTDDGGAVVGYVDDMAPMGASSATLRRRATYGGRKGRRAEARLRRGQHAPDRQQFTSTGSGLQFFEGQVVWLYP